MTEGFDLFERLAETGLGRNILADFESMARARDGVAATAQWEAEDGWIIVYTTGRVRGGPHDGKFLCQVFRPTGPGARTGKHTERTVWRQVYRREFSTRKVAKARAVALFRQHSPKWDAKHPKKLER